jgi:hypothetical protein
MSSTHTSLHYHLIFATKHREPILAKECRHELHAYLGGIVNGLDAYPECIGGELMTLRILFKAKSSNGWNSPVPESRDVGHCSCEERREAQGSSWLTSIMIGPV